MEEIERKFFFATKNERKLGSLIVAEELGEDFRLNFDLYPHNVGVKGDERVDGETVEIEYLAGNPLNYYLENQEHLAHVSTRLVNELPSVTKVLFNIVNQDKGHQESL